MTAEQYVSTDAADLQRTWTLSGKWNGHTFKELPADFALWALSQIQELDHLTRQGLAARLRIELNLSAKCAKEHKAFQKPKGLECLTCKTVKPLIDRYQCRECYDDDRKPLNFQERERQE